MSHSMWRYNTVKICYTYPNHGKALPIEHRVHPFHKFYLDVFCSVFSQTLQLSGKPWEYTDLYYILNTSYTWKNKPGRTAKVVKLKLRIKIIIVEINNTGVTGRF